MTLDEYEHRQYLQYLEARTCTCCGEKIMDREYCFDGDYYCEDCMRNEMFEDILAEYEVRS